MFKKKLFNNFSKISSAESSRSNSSKSESLPPPVDKKGKYVWTEATMRERLENTLPLPKPMWSKLGINDIICFMRKDGVFNGGYNRIVKKTEKGLKFSFSKGGKNRTWLLNFDIVDKIYIQKSILYELMFSNMKKIEYIISEFEKLKS
jgi:hypothetical protein